MNTQLGTVGVAGAPAKALSWAELATSAAECDEQLAGEFDFHQDGATFPFGAHIAIVEVDVSTGFVRLVRHVSVDDCGRVLAPLLVEGQQHGGIAAGVGQALFEEVRYDLQGNPNHVEPRGLRDPDRERPTDVRCELDGNANPAQPAGGQRHRRGGNHRFDSRPCRTR